MTKTDLKKLDDVLTALCATDEGTPERRRASDALLALITANPSEKFVFQNGDGIGFVAHEGDSPPLATSDPPAPPGAVSGGVIPQS